MIEDEFLARVMPCVVYIRLKSTRFRLERDETIIFDLNRQKKEYGAS
jgi:hypothetical protein